MSEKKNLIVPKLQKQNLGYQSILEIGKDSVLESIYIYPKSSVKKDFHRS